ncbi:MAG: metalloregulator ArsR/SmtB family transcription factor [Candidatus Syntrophosphaera sp.]
MNDQKSDQGMTEKELQVIRKGMPSERTIEYLGDFFSVFGDATRLRILYLLSHGEFRVADIASFVGMGQSTVSHQLKILRLNRLVKFRREGTTIFYSLDDAHVGELLGTALEHIREGMPE